MYPEMRDRVAVVTGAGHGIGKAIALCFLAEGVRVAVMEKNGDLCKRLRAELEESGENLLVVNADAGRKEDLEDFARQVKKSFGQVDFLVHNAPPAMKGIDACSYEDFMGALAVGVAAPFYLTKLLAAILSPGASIVNISSSRDRMSQAQTESYTAAKGGIHALTHALAVSLAGKARVNSISPGWIDTEYRTYQGPDASQQPAGRVGNPMDIAQMVLFLCSDKAGFITGENILIDGGMTRQMIYHGDAGWSLEG